jgi:hypothetical protein
MFTAIDFRGRAQLLLHLVAEVKPALEVAGAYFALLAGLVTGSLAGHAALDLGSIGERKYKILRGLLCGLGFRGHEIPPESSSIASLPEKVLAIERFWAYNAAIIGRTWLWTTEGRVR